MRPTNAKKLVKFGPALAEIFCMICRFCRFVPKGTETPCEIFAASRPIFTKIAQNVAKRVPFINSKSELRYSYPLRNASVLNKGHFANFAQNHLVWQRP